MKFLTKPDGNVFKTLGSGRLPENGSMIRPSLFAVPYDVCGKKLIFNTMTRQTLEAEDIFDIFLNKRELAFDKENADMAELVRRHFLVPKNADEVKNYLGTIEVLRLLDKKLAPGHKAYVILPTTACNARCFYCYENGIEFKSMDDKTADDVVNYIIKSNSDGNVNIRWFGGEPLMGEGAIDRICAGLDKNGIVFFSTITTNASLVTPELAKKMHDVWKIRHAQITLDGRREEYLRRKAYVPGYEDAYERVIAGIHLLLDNKIGVSIRLNADENNIDELFLLADELAEEFKNRRNIIVYANALFAGCAGGNRSSDTALHGSIALLSEKLYRLGIASKHNEGRLTTYRCMADTPNGAAVIAPDGKLFCCEHMIPESEVGSIYDCADEWKRRRVFVEINQRAKKRPECLKCRFLPECTLSAHCPTEGADCVGTYEQLTAQRLLKYSQMSANQRTLT